MQEQEPPPRALVLGPPLQEQAQEPLQQVLELVLVRLQEEVLQAPLLELVEAHGSAQRAASGSKSHSQNASRRGKTMTQPKAPFVKPFQGMFPRGARLLLQREGRRQQAALRVPPH